MDEVIDDDVVALKAAFVNASYGKMNGNILRCTSVIDNNVIIMQFVMRRGFSEDDVDDAYDILGDVLGLSDGFTGRAEIVDVDGADELLRVDPLQVILFRVSDRQL
ncbi:hypothetical protein [Brevundimonas sp. P7753]|uniref:hypothetical protein n=1 Tax=Brevundimonas sp. P7753 TaxID=2726982 RepID=UPI0015BC9A28|nr:hypothetical protein [Brevundimonas sp. P7753]NWE54541.1 hypothetical protein [Brevundimonas sp. P7753]